MIVTNKEGKQDRWVEEDECFFEVLPPHEMTDCFYVNFLATFVLFVFVCLINYI